MSETAIMNLLSEYRDKFGEPFPVWGYEEDEAIALIRRAIDKGEPVTEGAESDIPKGAIL